MALKDLMTMEPGFVKLHEKVRVADNAAVTVMPTGVTEVIGATIAGGNCTAALANGKYIGERKGFYVTTAVVTNAFVVTPATAGLQKNGSTALVSFSMDAADEWIILEWDGVRWREVASAGTTLADS
jgi:hypothetical protein